MKKMRKSASNVNNAVNLISGAYTLPLIDKLFEYSGAFSITSPAIGNLYSG